MNTKPGPNELLTVREVCAMLKLGRSTVYSLINSRQLRAIKIGGSTRIREEAVQEFLQKSEDYGT
ncbi:MAG: helix-turn-helix domain-containing protein [Armatimonadetes bacterium]|nr:helix-turn-helix domain-containing protein [Armatimonadota bacterium]